MFLLPATHLVVVVDVAALALALSVVLAETRVDALGGGTTPPILVVAVVAHAHGVEG